MDQSTCATPSSTTIPRPTRPKRPLHAELTDAARAAWGDIPTAAPAPVTMTRAQVQEQLAASAYDEHALGFGAIHAHSAFAA